MLTDGDVDLRVGVSAGAETERMELYEDWRGGNGGALGCFGGELSKLIRGALSNDFGGEWPLKKATGELGRSGPSSITQSLRSIREDLCRNELGDVEGV